MSDLGRTVEDVHKGIVPHRAWRRARQELAEVLSGGHRIVVVLGGRGTGKSLLVKELSALLTAGGMPAVVRTPAAARPENCQVDLVDDVDEAALGVLAREEAPPKLRIVAMRANGAPTDAALGGLSPRPQIVRLGALDTGDVQAIVEARLLKWGLPRNALTARAALKIRRVTGGNPAAVHQVINRAIRLAIDAGSPRVLGEHVERAVAPDPPPPVFSLLAAAVVAPPPPAAAEEIPQPPAYRSVIAELGAQTVAAMEASDAKRAARRRRTRLAAGLLGVAVIGGAAVAGPDRLSAAFLAAKSSMMRAVHRSIAGPNLAARQP